MECCRLLGNASCSHVLYPVRKMCLAMCEESLSLCR